ncbi:MAG: rhomboid family intramembrane serine protease [Planctomycetaceae bacterium]|nr:rhomboid family intramembrane serine protease [Planctomycetaceae bacterium]
MFPLRDDIQSRHTPVVNYTLIALCVAAFVAQMSDPSGLVDQFGMIPARISHPGKDVVIESRDVVLTPFGPQERVVQKPLGHSRFHPVTTLLSCIFLHGSVMHLLGNMWFLWVFGDNVEDRMGSSGYLLFYLGSGIAASLTHYAFQPQSVVPTIGASGAVAGVMGAYMWLYPHARVLTVIPIFFILQTIIVPAPVFLGIWFVLQLVQGTYSMGAAEAAGVAWWAHAGGFAFGFAVAWMLGSRRPTQPRVYVVPRRCE